MNKKITLIFSLLASCLFTTLEARWFESDTAAQKILEGKEKELGWFECWKGNRHLEKSFTQLIEDYFEHYNRITNRLEETINFFNTIQPLKELTKESIEKEQALLIKELSLFKATITAYQDVFNQHKKSYIKNLKNKQTMYDNQKKWEKQHGRKYAAVVESFKEEDPIREIINQQAPDNKKNLQNLFRALFNILRDFTFASRYICGNYHLNQILKYEDKIYRHKELDNQIKQSRENINHTITRLHNLIK